MVVVEEALSCLRLSCCLTNPPPTFFLSPCACSGWRVEFRPCEVQLTDFENAAFSVFIVLLTRTILSFGLNLYMPLSKVHVCACLCVYLCVCVCVCVCLCVCVYLPSPPLCKLSFAPPDLAAAHDRVFALRPKKVDENMATAQRRDAARQHKFWFPKVFQGLWLRVIACDCVCVCVCGCV